jgi:hypothetical protein
MWRGNVGFSLSVSASFVWRCLNSRTIAPFPHPPHRTQRAYLRHWALGQDITPSPTAGHVPTQSSGQVRNSRRDARVDRSRLVGP